MEEEYVGNRRCYSNMTVLVKDKEREREGKSRIVGFKNAAKHKSHREQSDIKVEKALYLLITPGKWRQHNSIQMHSDQNRHSTMRRRLMQRVSSFLNGRCRLWAAALLQTDYAAGSSALFPWPYQSIPTSDPCTN